MFIKLETERSGYLKRTGLKTRKRKAKRATLAFSDFIMLMDIFVEGKGVVFCSAEGTELDPSVQGFQDDQDFEMYKDVCRAVVRADCEPEGKEQWQWESNKVGGYYRSFNRRRLRSDIWDPWSAAGRSKLKRDGMVFSWKLMRKSDGKVKIPLDMEPVKCNIYEVVGKGPYSSFHFDATGDISKVGAVSKYYSYMSVEWHQPLTSFSLGTGEGQRTLNRTTSEIIGSCAIAVGFRAKFVGDYPSPAEFLRIVGYETVAWL